MLSPRARTPRGLELALEEVLDLPHGHARIVQLVGGYTPIDEDQRMRLSQKTAILGRGAVLGSQAYERGNRFRIRLGPMSASEYPHYIGKGARVELVREVVNLMVREPFDYDLELLLRRRRAAGVLDFRAAGYDARRHDTPAGRGRAAERHRCATSARPTHRKQISEPEESSHAR